MMHISMIFDLDACICDAGFFVSDGPTNGQVDSRSCIYLIFINLISEQAQWKDYQDLEIKVQKMQ